MSHPSRTDLSFNPAVEREISETPIMTRNAPNKKF